MDAEPLALSRLLRTPSSLGVFTEDDAGASALTPLGAPLVSDAPGAMRDLARTWMETHYAPFAGLLGAVRTGACAATEHYGQPFFPWLAEQPEQVDRFDRAMANLTNGPMAGAVAS